MRACVCVACACHLNGPYVILLTMYPHLYPAKYCDTPPVKVSGVAFQTTAQ